MPHLQSRLQEPLDRSAWHGVHVVEQRGDQAGTGYPTLYEDQEQYDGGWVLEDGQLRLKLGSKKSELINLSYNPRLPTLDDYYHPWTYRYKDLIDAPLGDDQPVARPISMITGEDMEIEAGPNWDDDLSGSPITRRTTRIWGS